MPFTGFPFLLGFLPLTLAGFAVFTRFGESWGKTWLIAMSLLFYGIATPENLPLLILSIAGNYALLRAMAGPVHAARIAASGVAANLAILAAFKYAGTDAVLGLSFFTFTQIGCLLHHAAGDTLPPRPRDYALFAAFFPALLAGPILNPHDSLSQYAGRLSLTAVNLATGIGFFLVGLLKKTLLADPLAGIVTTGFANPADLALWPAWQAAASYSLQLYFDFSGYTDMAIGLAWMVGLRFPDNFDQPYRASSIIAYWQRWHMSLTRFLMANIHAPLTLAILRHRRNRGQRIDQAAQATLPGFLTMIAAPVAATMLLVALWHGATLPFLAFGLLHTGFLLINHIWRTARLPPPPRLAAIALTYIAVLVGAVFFRASSLAGATELLSGMAGLHGTERTHPHLSRDIIWLASLYAIVWCAPTTRQWLQPAHSSRVAWRPTPGWAIAMGGLATLALLAAGGTGEFLYFRF